MRAAADEPGILLAKLEPPHSPRASLFDADRHASRIVRDAFVAGDAWYVSTDVARRDSDGDYYYVDRQDDVIRTRRGAVPSRDVEDVLLRARGVALAAVFPSPSKDGWFVPEAVLVPSVGETIDGAEITRLVTEKLAPHERPRNPDREASPDDGSDAHLEVGARGLESGERRASRGIRARLTPLAPVGVSGTPHCLQPAVPS